MSFVPRYTITNQLLANITRVHTLVAQLNSRRFPNIVRVEFEKAARAVSSYASTSIEGNPLPLTEVKQILKNHPAHARDSEKEVLNYNNALEMLNSYEDDTDEHLTLELILQIQKHATNDLLPANESGRLRQVPVVVHDPRSGKIVYMPPDFSEIQGLVNDLLEFVKLNQKELDPLILAGLFHRQLVLIHPFTDGNGRTARLATKLLLARMGLDTFNLFNFENYYNKNVTKYFQTVGEFGDYYDIAKKADFTVWLEYFTAGIIDELLRVEALLPKAMTPETSLQPYHQMILDTIQEKGFVTDKEYAAKTDRAKATRNLDFQKLIDLGLIERKGQSRASYYVISGQNK